MYVKMTFTKDFQIKVEEIDTVNQFNDYPISIGYYSYEDCEIWVIDDIDEAIEKLRELQHKQFIKFSKMINNMDI